jgi:hypothetical protein
VALVVLSILCVSDRPFAAEPSVSRRGVRHPPGLALLMDVQANDVEWTMSSSMAAAGPRSGL